MQAADSNDGAVARRQTFLALAFIIAITAAVRAPLLSVPFERDEGEYAYIGWRLGHGELPYRDWIDQKPPAIFWIYRLALSLPDDPVRAVHLLALMWSAASACALFLLARQFMSHGWATIAAALFAVLSAHPLIEGTAANTEIFMLLPLILSVLSFLGSFRDRQTRVWPIFVCGASIGLAAAFKQVAAVNWPFLVCIYPFFCSGEKRWRSTFTFAALSAVGGALIWIVIGAYFHFRGGFRELVYNVLTHNLEYIHAMPWSARLKACYSSSATLSRVQAVTWVFAIVGLIAMLRSHKGKLSAVLLGWLLASMAGVSASGYYFPHYFQQILPVLAVLAALGGEALAAAAFWKNISSAFRIALIAALLAVLPLASIFPFLFRYSPAEAVRKIYPFNVFAEMPYIAKRIAELTRPHDRVFVFGAEAELLFYSKRVSATRYIFLFPLYGPYRDARTRQEATAAEVSTNRPAVIAYFPNALFFKPETEQFFTQWTDTYMKENFRADIYVTRDQAGVGHLSRPAENGEFAISAGEQLVGIVYVRKRTE